MLTSQDIKLLVDTFKTRAEADEDLRKLKEEMATKGMFRGVMTKLNAVFKELKDMRQEQDVHVQKHRDIDEKLDKLSASI
ncbi:MAG: hypothetical protein NUV73_03710 [Candidatus Daviesbacteria bacterium]|nr:hypothetical protein [Candidatus Daviesbacteria bacterium]